MKNICIQLLDILGQVSYIEEDVARSQKCSNDSLVQLAMLPTMIGRSECTTY